MRDAGISLRIRKRVASKDIVELTVKSDQRADKETGLLERNELALLFPADTALHDMVSSPDAIEVIERPLGTKELIEIVSIFNKRKKILVETEQGFSAHICFDTFYFRQNGEFSEYNYEIEAEIVSQPQGSESSLRNLKKLLKGLSKGFGFNASTKSKLEQAEERGVSKDNRHHYVHFFGIDIVGYTKLDSKKQLNVVQRINKATKDILRNSGVNPSEIDVVIPTGDGVVVGFDGYQPKLLKTLVDLQTDIASRQTHFSNVGIRAAVHYGPVFHFTDLTEKISLAGDGINDMFRLLQQPSENQIFVSKAAYEKEMLSKPNMKADFFGPNSVSVKHGQEVIYYNYFREREFGHPN